MYVGRIEKLLAYYTPVPMCIINAQGKVTRSNNKIAEVFKYDGIIGMDFFQLTGVKLVEIKQAAADDVPNLENTMNGKSPSAERKPIVIERNDRAFKLECNLIGDGDNASLIIQFIDVTSYENLKKLYNNDRMSVAIIQIDNYDEIVTGSGDEEGVGVDIIAKIDKLLRQWIASKDGVITKYKDHLYKAMITQKCVAEEVEDKFSILDKVREIESNTEFPVSISIGIGWGGTTIAKNDLYAQDAMDMALGRGGDQAVIKRISSFEYYGGKTQSVEKSNKGKSRIIAHALRTLMGQSSKIFIMGHKNPDMDCFGAALGVYRIAAQTGKDAFIVMNGHNETMDDIVRDAKSTGNYEFISSDRALEMVEDKALVVVVDTHRPGLVESVDLIEKTDRLAVIDHHRRVEDALQNQSLSYMESYASSASELVTEMLQYVIDKKELDKIEADALLAGIMLDTNRFAVKAGVRTFEAASWLKRAGADLQNVRRYFQADSENFRARAAGIANARILESGIALSICDGCNVNAQVINSQVADELLTIKGIEASFVAGVNENGETVVSARSLGTLNVQTIMEKFGGGGHLNTAGAKVDMSPKEVLEKIEEFLQTTH
ncbi:MAG: DHH family phosphoesterase [Firmicutes bacterium]|nr:DHH family phosphoesterase [Bacillota bacterium]